MGQEDPWDLLINQCTLIGDLSGKGTGGTGNVGCGLHDPMSEYMLLIQKGGEGERERGSGEERMEGENFHLPNEAKLTVISFQEASLAHSIRPASPFAITHCYLALGLMDCSCELRLVFPMWGR